MFILEKKIEPTQQIWSHIKQHYPGEKIAFIGIKKQLPHTFFRNKQITFYENLEDSPSSLLNQGKEILYKLSKDYSAIVFYVDCPKDVAEQLIECGKNLCIRLTVTTEEKVA
ncbi:hypothetical protein KUA55_16480 [Enterococcus sp. ALS3]|uniref:Uncharacterized protein n=1 Tax=Enterococcus alishanensis TaxID=1303817 RepID=A0ABS6TH49_9ENTE|nr:hypothetical protein [Enterococcus alishanensis]MBV7392281.1 hypothetical protein [Enterococcus alishanensis]